VTAYNEADNTVDLSVRVHDVWTLSPGISFGRNGGTNSTRMELEESNLLGFGKRVEFWSSQDVDRSSLRIRYQDPNILGSWWRLGTTYATSSDGDEKTIDIARPFYSLDTRWSAGFTASDVTSGVARYRLGEAGEQFAIHRRVLDVNGGISDGLEGGWVRRYLAGMRYESREFSPFHDQPATLPTDRTVSYPWLGIELFEDNYIKIHNFNQIRRTEDVHLGLAARLEAGYAAPALGSTRTAVVVNGSVSLGSAISERQHLLTDAAMGGRVEEGEIRNGTFALSSRYYLSQNAYSAFFASAAMTMSANLDPETQLMLGGDNGLRGYPLRYQSGTRHALVTLEERFYTGWQPLKLVDVGAAVFFDAGRMWGSDPYGGEPSGWLKAAGLGLRLGNARTALGNILHIDLAFPLDGPPEIAKMQVIVETRRSF
jgi:outer membrane protein assembly factor BamA